MESWTCNVCGGQEGPLGGHCREVTPLKARHHSAQINTEELEHELGGDEREGIWWTVASWMGVDPERGAGGKMKAIPV